MRKNSIHCHSRGSGSPEYLENTGFPLPREWDSAVKGKFSATCQDKMIDLNLNLGIMEWR
jgi:hypothetical protein